MAEEGDFKPLSHDILAACLSEIKLAVGGGGYAFTKLDCSEKELTNLGNKIENYEQMRHITLSSNRIADLAPLVKLPHLLTLQVDSNAVTSLACLAAEGVTLPWLQRISLSGNKLTSLPPLAALERLRFANFSSNEITSLEEFGDHPALEELDLQGNQLTTLKGMGALEKLNKLWLKGNQLESLEGLNVPALTMLDLGGNKLAKLEGIGGAAACVELDLSGNQLSMENPNMPELRHLGQELKKMRSIKIEGNATDPLRNEILICAPQVKEIDGEPVTQEDKDNAKARKKELVDVVKEYEEKKAAEGEKEGEEAES